MRLLLLSNSANHGRGYLDHAVEEVRAFLGEIRRLTFVPFALHDHAAYGAKVAGRLRPLGIEVETLMDDDRARDVITGSDALFVGGGNTFRLLDRLHRKGLVEAIRDRVGSGAPYMGASAGTVISSPTMKTTNDMPIVQPPSFQALGLVRFQINPHYLDPDPASTHMGETRETRLAEFLEENETPVLGLREGSWLEEVPAGSDLTFLNRA
jgi:dipeptidase E